jgi:hypothetical protein
MPLNSMLTTQYRLDFRMKYLVLFTALLVWHVHAIIFVLFEDNTCDNLDEDPAYTCMDYDYDECCGMFPSSGQLYGAAAVALSDTPVMNTPVLRAGNVDTQPDAPQPPSPCAQIRQQEVYTANTDTTFPCIMAAVPQSYNGFIVESIVTSRMGKRQQNPGHPSVPGGNGIGVIENGTIYALKRTSENYMLYEQKKDGMTVQERRAFVITHSEQQSKVDFYLRG